MTRAWISTRAHRKRKWLDSRKHLVECDTREPPPPSRPLCPRGVKNSN